MIIRSQDREKIVNLNNITRIDIDNGSNGINVWASSMGITSLLGTYSTEEKAIKVLDVIQSSYEEANSVCTMSGFVANTVFQMPQDSEV